MLNDWKVCLSPNPDFLPFLLFNVRTKFCACHNYFHCVSGTRFDQRNVHTLYSLSFSMTYRWRVSCSSGVSLRRVRCCCLRRMKSLWWILVSRYFFLFEVIFLSWRLDIFECDSVYSTLGSVVAFSARLSACSAFVLCGIVLSLLCLAMDQVMNTSWFD